MKRPLYKAGLLAATIAVFASCKKFDDINIDPQAANVDQVQVEYFINNSMIGAQMDPHIAERVFVLYWKTAGHQQASGGISSGAANDSWSSDYYSYISGWLNSINTGIQVAEEKIAAGNVKPYTNNLLQVARIWRAYLMSELSDNFGPIPINGFQGVNPEFADVKTVYYYLLSELKDASTKLDESISNPSNLAKQDPAYGYNYNLWKRYANSMRLRLAMRLSEVDAAKAKSEFEAAASGILITDAAQMFQVQEKPGWDALTGVMSREWNAQMLPVALDNIMFGLGGVKSADQVGAAMQASIKPADYVGKKYDQHLSLKTNNPRAGFWYDGLPNSIDPRAYKAFIIPGDFNNPSFCAYPSWDNSSKTTVRKLLASPSNAADINVDATYTWNSYNAGDWGAIGSRNQVRGWAGSYPRLALQFRNSTSKRVFFAPWETYFLLAEAAERGWTVPMSAKVAYEAGIASSFAYWGVSNHLAAYLASNDYNALGTSVNYDHITEPGASRTMSYVDGYTNTAGTTTIAYPTNNLYKNGTVRNDRITKIITQKFIAQTPWLPLEAWNDHRRLGLPFIENPCIENPLVTMPALNSGNYMTSNVKFFPQRLIYPSGLKNSNANGYTQALQFLGGADDVFTSLWWAKK